MGRYLSLGLFAGAFAVGALVTALVRWPPSQSSDWAAWVQAVGSIGAIVAAIWIQARQRAFDRANERRRELSELKRKFEAWDGIATAAIEVIRGLPPSGTPMDDAAIILTGRDLRVKYRTAVDALHSIQIDTVSPYPLMATILDLRRDLAHLDPLILPAFPRRDAVVGNWLRMDGEIEEMRARTIEYIGVFDAYGAGLNQAP
ncbi:hypothetical protein [Burkholderia gladioli]|uniref:hypothetical protein n=1 Tax=Burkholderia gladioli TaxID=28095 RepID=UPI00163E06C9|nr:hypothetical protein [Burkholderia gladioli]